MIPHREKYGYRFAKCVSPTDAPVSLSGLPAAERTIRKGQLKLCTDGVCPENEPSGGRLSLFDPEEALMSWGPHDRHFLYWHSYSFEGFTGTRGYYASVIVNYSQSEVANYTARPRFCHYQGNDYLICFLRVRGLDCEA